MTDNAPDPLIIHLFNRMPAPGTVWIESDRVLWLEALESTLNLVYGSSDNIPSTTKPTVLLEPPKVTAAVDEKIAETICKTENRPTRGPARPPEQKMPAGPRPEGMPTNLAVALEAIDSLGGKAGANQIENYVREKHWPEVNHLWKNCLLTLATQGKLARDGINFVRPKAKPPAVVPTVQAKKPPGPKPASSPKKQFTSEAFTRFEHNDRSIELPARCYVLASKLKAAMGQHIAEAFLAEKVMGANTENNRSTVREVCLGMNDLLGQVGLSIAHYSGFGLIMKEVDVA